MTFIVACAPGQRGQAVLDLAALLARSSGDELVVAAIVPVPWAPGPAKVDAEYHAYLDAEADAALDSARSAMPGGVRATYLRHAARSAPAGLLELAAAHAAGMIVVGSSSAGVFGHVALGSVSDRLLHSSPIPIAMAPRGFRTRGTDVVELVTAAYGGSPEADDLVMASAQVAVMLGASLRLASFAVRPMASVTTGAGTNAEESVQREWAAMVEQRATAALARGAGLPRAPRSIETAIGFGHSWAQAMDDIPWSGNDILVVGSSQIGPVARVFLGSRATKLVRHAPVPVIVLPKVATPSLTSQTDDGFD